ncbi:non-specific lipid-transfer protein A-like [Gastrolobium bilobum]|uniref:non-specific lipid-transfer protein A-like n=1 Tax=Gastrolobium bilobum TaxID=150636 RepID=UPI002AB207A1|nr:non-specific lipid-transfer protein A-like [Gastrolobium bilobum]
MMKRVVVVAFPTLLVLALLVLTVEPGKALTCPEAETLVFPCIGYLGGVGGAGPSVACCDGIKNLKSSTPTTNERRAACQCLKDAAIQFPALRDDLAASLPKRCGVDVGFNITKNIDCNS